MCKYYKKLRSVFFSLLSTVFVQYFFFFQINLIRLTFGPVFNWTKKFEHEWASGGIGYECVLRIEKIFLGKCRASSREHKLKFAEIVVPQVCVVYFTSCGNAKFHKNYRPSFVNFVIVHAFYLLFVHFFCI